MITWIKKKLKDNDLMFKVTCIVTAVVLVNRLFTFIMMMLLGNDAGFYKIDTWSSFDYTLAMMLPVLAYAYFCSSSYSKNHFKKVKGFVITGMLVAVIAALMLSEWSYRLFEYFLSFWGTDVIERALSEGYPIVASTLRYFICYLPLLGLFIASGYLFDAVNWPDSKGQLLFLSLLDNSANTMPVGEYTCEVAVCKDASSGKSIIVPENRRMEATLIQGATGTGKTSTLLLPMCASDIEKKFFFREKAKKAAIEVLDKGYAYIDAPFSAEELNERFSLEYIKPVKGKEEEFDEIISKFVRYIDPETHKTVYKDLGITVVEPDGKFCGDFKKVAANFGVEVKTIDPQDPNSYGMNPFQIEDPDEVASIIATVLQGMYESENPGGNNIFFGQVTQQALENLAILLKVMYPRMHDGLLPTLEDMLKMLYDYNIVELMCEEMKKDPELSAEYKILIKYFEKNFYNPPYDLNGRPIQGTVGSGRKDTEKFLYGAATQLDNLMRHDMVKQILCSRDKNLDFDEVLRTGQCVSVCTRRGELGALLSKPFGMFFILSMQAAVLRRPGTENTRIPHFLYIDEFPDFVNKETETCFTLFRKYRCAMIVAIQNLSQLSRTSSMKFYRQVVVSNTKTQLVFGDTNVEDSQYWSDVYGRREVLKVGNSLALTPMLQVSEGSAGISGEDYSAKVNLTEKIKPHVLNQLPFKSLYYVTRDAKGNKKLGKGKTDFLKPKYKEKHEPAKFDFTKYRAYHRTALDEGYWSDSISAQETEENYFLDGKYE